MRRTLLHLCTWPLLLIMLTSGTENDDGKAGRTGAPGEQTCVNTCHNSFALNSGPGSITLSSPDLVNWTYAPGETYSLELTIEQTGIGLFGMGLGVLDASGANAGQLIITDPGSTQLKSAVVLGNVRTNVVHTLNGGGGLGSKTFTFAWTAPATDIGPVTFYYAGNAANGNGNDSGDRIYTGSQVVVPGSVGLAERMAGGALQAYPNPAHNTVWLDLRSIPSGRLTVELIDLQGRRVAVLLEEERPVGDRLEVVGGLERCPEGTYLLAWRTTTASGATPLVIAR